MYRIITEGDFNINLLLSIKAVVEGRCCRTKVFANGISITVTEKFLRNTMQGILNFVKFLCNEEGLANETISDNCVTLKKLKF